MFYILPATDFNYWSRKSMFGKLVYLTAVICFTTSLLFSQDNPEKVSTQTDKQKITTVIPSATIDDKVSLIEGKVTLVYDGDTVSVETKDRKIYSIWLKGVDAPESKQDYGKKSRKKLAEMIEGKDVKVVIYKKGLYDRYIGIVYLDGQDVGLKQIEDGMAWHYKQYEYEQTMEERKKYAQAQQKAQSEKIGLWEDKNPTPPWNFRNGITTKETDKKDVAPETPTNASNTSTTPSSTNSPDRVYIRGPRGGCYYVSESGRKVYVKDKSLCGN
jgi:endonuclease YncB( thermonuclease family)